MLIPVILTENSLTEINNNIIYFQLLQNFRDPPCQTP
jgi:hypothetical protein